MPPCVFCNMNKYKENVWMRVIGERAVCSECAVILWEILRVIDDMKLKEYTKRIQETIDQGKTFAEPGSVIHDALMRIEGRVKAGL